MGDDGGDEECALRVVQGGWFWIDVEGVTESEMSGLSKIFSIHPLTAEDVLSEDAETREKCEIYVNYYFIVMRTFDPDEYSLNYLQPVNMEIIVGRDWILSFHRRPLSHPKNVVRRMEQLKIYGMQINPDWINYALVDDVVDSFAPVVRGVEFEVESIDDLVLILTESEQTDMLRRIGHARKKLSLLLRLLSGKSDVLRTLVKRARDRFAHPEVSLYLGDIQDHVLTSMQNLDHHEKTLARSHSNYLAQISIEITQSSNKTNDVVMKMTALASILVPLNIVTGLWGMNVSCSYN
ncbi:hypothetical protein M427DRAFT_92830 [Gonapodya prolifera JEL478]|uniref:Mg2+ transporter protein n=1 Tax=Gonapodya prolifera (strain JEL478) TaxID=1344416 RepID=A0A139AZG1_GONPJ|nr:hypothetical protein M427DRAFT_92830 [Gonapodya prolifera JEL478]|eukprot:KXS22122.1 hypothetical protein M427DRAFT_92830 [Gonapodya prolifera JEL478]